MNKDVDKMIAEQRITLKIVIKGQGYVGDRPAMERAVKCCLLNAIPVETGHADMLVCLNMTPVIEDKRALE